MPANNLAPPRSLNHLKYFVVRFHRADDFHGSYFELIEPGKTESFNLGNQVAALAYFKKVGQEYLGERALHAAYSFGASQALISDQRAWGLDLCRIDLDKGIVRDRDIDEGRRLWTDGDDEDDTVFVL